MNTNVGRLAQTSQGACLELSGRCRWRVWAPRAESVQLILSDRSGGKTAHSMQEGADRYFEIELEGIEEGQRYTYSLNGREPRPDPASYWQPEGVHAASAVFRPDDFQWTDGEWKGVPQADLILYELHVGTFTPEGTFAAIIPRLPALRELGVTAIELMPVAQFPGMRNWGYDGTYWYAVQNSYGGPRELQKLVDACHQAGFAVFLDVVYNHLGPEGNYLSEFGDYLNAEHLTPWGGAINLDAPGSPEVRAFILNNVRHWIRHFHVDGLRLDAVHALRDESPRHLLADIKHVAESESAELGRQVCISAESDVNDVQILNPSEQGGCGLDAQWNDDFHHCVHALMTGERDGYYVDFSQPRQQLFKQLKQTFCYTGEQSVFRGRPHGAPVGDLSAERFIVSIQNHDQIGNRPFGERISELVDTSQLRLASALLLLSPFIPLLFMGEEYGEGHRFPFFCHYGDVELQEAVRHGRRQQFLESACADAIPDPQCEQTFLSAKLTWDWPDWTWQGGLRRLYGDLIQMRRTLPALREPQHYEVSWVPSELANGVPPLKLLRGDPRNPQQQVTILFNLSPASVLLPVSASAPLRPILSTEDLRYNGNGRPERFGRGMLPYECVVLIKPEETS